MKVSLPASLVAKLKQIRLNANQLDPKKLIGSGLIFVAFIILIYIGAILVQERKVLFTSEDKLVSIKLPHSFINQTADKQRLMPELLPDLNTINITLLATNPDKTQIIYSQMIKMDQPYQEASPSSFADFIQNSLSNRPDLQNISVEILSPEKKQIYFSATNHNHNGKEFFLEGCLLTIQTENLISVCSRQLNENNISRAKQLTEMVTVKTPKEINPSKK